MGPQCRSRRSVRRFLVSYVRMLVLRPRSRAVLTGHSEAIPVQKSPSSKRPVTPLPTQGAHDREVI
jgi:hypothetical protein